VSERKREKMRASNGRDPQGEPEVGWRAFSAKTLTNRAGFHPVGGCAGHMCHLRASEEDARQSRATRRDVYGMLVSGLISVGMGMKLSGPGITYPC